VFERFAEKKGMNPLNPNFWRELNNDELLTMNVFVLCKSHNYTLSRTHIFYGVHLISLFQYFQDFSHCFVFKGAWQVLKRFRGDIQEALRTLFPSVDLTKDVFSSKCYYVILAFI
jgi:hypothetical protein